MTTPHDRALGAFIGLAVGDALGTTLEFERRDVQPPLTDMIGGGPFGLLPGQWTDDTAMALALAESLIECNGLDAADLMRRFVSWWRAGTYSCTGTCFDIGMTTRSALRRFEVSGEPLAGDTSPDSAGNGALMRLAPIALRWPYDSERRRDAAKRQTLTTHGAATCVDASLVFADMLASAISGEQATPLTGAKTTEVAAIVGGSWHGKQRNEIKSSGYVVHSLEAALWCMANSDDFASAVLLAANLGDDADTVAAITGQLAGARYGLAAIPARWQARLAWSERLLAAGEALIASATWQ